MKMLTEAQQQALIKQGVELAIRRILSTNLLIHGTQGYGAALKRSVDLGKQDEVDALVFDLLNSQA